ncbi:MAG: stage 0 sporulation family protein [Saprospiraceae bacterium]
MGCSSCGSASVDGKPSGCNSNGGCATGGCNRLNTFDWLTDMDIHDPSALGLVEVSFKNGARKGFYRNDAHTFASTGDMVIVESGNGFDIGKVSLTGELVRMQMKKKKVPEDGILPKVIRKANDRDMERLSEARAIEKPTMIRARAIARTLDLDMKIGDIEYQGDKRKATFYYTADGRVDFRELIRHFAKEFRVKVEMRQIGARQESARIGGIGSCGRELCCSTWLTDFKSVSTAAARYQNLAINQSKLSGQCGRLKCCLNYELDSYMDALEHFPKHADKLKTQAGFANLIKTDIFKGLLYYAYARNGAKGKIIALKLERVKEILALNKKGEFPLDLVDIRSLMAEGVDSEEDLGFEDVTGAVELPPEERKRRRNRNRNRNKNRNKSRTGGKDDANKGNDRSGNKPKSNGRTGGKPGTKSNAKGTKNNEKGAPKNQGQGRPKKKSNNNNKSEDNKGNQNRTNNKNADNANGNNKPSNNKNRRNRNKNRNRNRKPNANQNPDQKTDKKPDDQ